MPRIHHSLKFQIGVAISLLTTLFAASTLYSLHVIDQQQADDALVRLAGRLQFNQQQLTVQAMRYQENAPRDYPSYNRDLRLYFEDLKNTRAKLTEAIEAFAANRFDVSLTGDSMAMPPRLPARSHAIAGELAETWNDFSRKLDEKIGPDLNEPRLEWAAQWISENDAALESIAQRLSGTLRNDVADRAARANLINRSLLLSALLVALGTAWWFYRRVLAPLTAAVDGFKQVANGDFAHKVPISHDNEIGWLAQSFNHLSDRMDALRKLLTRLEQGADLEATLRTLSELLPPLIPVDWIGVLVRGPDGLIHLEMAFSDGRPDTVGSLSFEPDRTLLEECINSREPLHIPDVREMATLSPSYVFLQRLADRGRRDAIMLPIGGGAAIQGVAVFASRYPNNFRSEHLALLRNLGVLLGISLGRTIQLVESSRLATIGQFASGIAHEIRNPLGTIGLALEYLQSLDGLPDAATKRLAIASGEVSRLERLLADMLTYAKPLPLSRRPDDLPALVAETAATEMSEAQPIEVHASACPAVAMDRDRMRQVLLNLLHNAQHASPEGTAVRVRCEPGVPGWVEVRVSNAGPPIPEKIMERIFEPFVTTKATGTGLGLAIVHRIVRAHAGQINLVTGTPDGTTVTVRLPTAQGGTEASDVAEAQDRIPRSSTSA